MRTGLLLIAAGGHAAEVLAYYQDLVAAGAGDLQLLGAIDDVRPVGPWETTQVLGSMSQLPAVIAAHQHDFQAVHYITCVGNNQTRRSLVQRLNEVSGLSACSLRHPVAYVGRNVEIGVGTLLAPLAIVTTRCKIGQHCIVNARASIHHDCKIGDFVNINPSATLCGGVTVGDEAFIGAGATIINGQSVGARAVIGAGAVVTQPIPNDVTAVGVPARIVKDRRS